MAADGDIHAPARQTRVLMTGDTVGGVWQYSLELSGALIERGYQVVLITMGAFPTREQRAEADAVKGLVHIPSAYKLLWMDDAWPQVEAASQWLLDLAQQVRPDIVHLNDFGHGDLPWPAPVLTVAHSCVMSWWRAVHACEAPPTWARYRQSVMSALRAADAVVAPSHAMLHALQREYGDVRRAQVIANGRSDLARQTPKLPCVFSAARVDDVAKNIEALSAIAPQLEWPVCIAGGVADDRESKPNDNTYRLGRLDAIRVRRWFAHASIYALPARYEPFGLSVLEAAQAGCALVLGDIDSLRENWEGAAAFVPPDDRDALTRTLRRLIADEPARRMLGAEARERAKRFTPAAMADAYCHLYDTIGAGQVSGQWRQGDVA